MSRSNQGLGNYSNEKTEQLLLYICDKMKDEKGFGSTVLNKVLYYVDSINYLHTGEPLSDLTYIKQKNGPTPKPSQFLPLRTHLISEGKLKVNLVDFFGRTQKRPECLINPNLERFTANEVSLIDRIIDQFKEIDGTLASHISHQEPAWEIANSMEELPFYTFLLTPQEDLNADDIDWATQSISEHRILHNN